LLLEEYHIGSRTRNNNEFFGKSKVELKIFDLVDNARSIGLEYLLQ